MLIETKNHEDRYSIEQIACLFFSRDADLQIHSEFSDGEIITTVKAGDNTSKASYRFENTDIKALKNAVKKSSFLAMKDLSGSIAPWGVLTGIRPTKFCRDLHKIKTYSEIRELLISEYWVREDKADFCVEVAENSERLIGKIAPNDIGIYIGVPFCPSRCSYCSFISESAALYSKYIPEYAKALKKEILMTAELVKEYGLNINSLYIGGGTPPALGVGLLTEVIAEALMRFDINPADLEFTVEAGRPDVITDELLAMLKEHGVNRLCINPQTMDDNTLRTIGRNHCSNDTVKAFELARNHSFNNINSDLIAGLPGEDEYTFAGTLSKINELSPESVTVHTMYLKRTSEITKSKAWGRCGADIEKMISLSQIFAKEQGYIPYYMYKQRSTMGNLENTGYAKPGFESLYNAAIMEEVQTIFACGAGASSKIVKGEEIDRVYNIKDAFSYIRDIDSIVTEKSEKIRNLLI